MTMIDWKDAFNTGFEPIDDHHRQIIVLLNCAYDNLADPDGSEETSRAIDELIDYTDYHFDLEECWMKESGYPGYIEHLEQHMDFATRALVIRQDLTRGWKNLPREVLSFLGNWLTYHIEADSGFALYIAESQWKKCA
jgi:hemerythrin